MREKKSSRWLAVGEGGNFPPPSFLFLFRVVSSYNCQQLACTVVRWYIRRCWRFCSHFYTRLQNPTKSFPEAQQVTIMEHKQTPNVVNVSLVYFIVIFSIGVATALIQPPYTILPVPGKGFGAIATRDIEIGTLLIEEAPLFSMTNRKPWFQPSESFVNDAVERTIHTLSTTEQAQFHDLHGFIPNVSSDDTRKFVPTALQIYSTNAYPMGPDRSGIFPLISRLNSECIPNVHYNYDERRQRATIHAISPITKGNEIVNSYIGLFLSRTERQQYLQRSFGFRCTCQACEPRDIQTSLDLITRGVDMMDKDDDNTNTKALKLLQVVATGNKDEWIRASDRRRVSLDMLEVATTQALFAHQRVLALDLVEQRQQLLSDEGISTHISTSTTPNTPFNTPLTNSNIYTMPHHPIIY